VSVVSPDRHTRTVRNRPGGWSTRKSVTPGGACCQSLSANRSSSDTTTETETAAPAGTSASTRTRCQRQREIPLSMRWVVNLPSDTYRATGDAGVGRGSPSQV
jgi:hypothetical protein